MGANSLILEYLPGLYRGNQCSSEPGSIRKLSWHGDLQLGADWKISGGLRTTVVDMTG